MRTLAFVSQKGGDGKTTCCVHVAAFAESKGETVCILDVDPQGSATSWHERRGNNEPMVLPTAVEKLPDVKGAAALMGVSLLMIDTAPAVDRGALAAIRVADLIVVPIAPKFYSLEALQSTVRLLEATGKKHLAVAIINQVPHQGAEKAIALARQQLEAYGIAVSPVHLGLLRAFETAAEKGRGVTEAAPKDRSATEIQKLWEYLDAHCATLVSKEAAE